MEKVKDMDVRSKNVFGSTTFTLGFDDGPNISLRREAGI